MISLRLYFPRVEFRLSTSSLKNWTVYRERSDLINVSESDFNEI